VFFHFCLLWLRFDNLLQQEQGHIQKQADQADALTADKGCSVVRTSNWKKNIRGNVRIISMV
jgi:hypothetical protein